MPATKHGIEYITEYNKGKYDRISVIFPKSEQIPELLNIAISQGIAKSKGSYICDAIIEQLIHDNIIGE